MRTLLLLLAASALTAEDRWLRFTAPVIEVFTNAGEKQGREMITQFEQFRYAFGRTIGSEEPRTLPTLRILLFKTESEARATGAQPGWQQGRDRLVLVTSLARGLTPADYAAAARLLLDTGIERMPPAFEEGLVTLYSTIRVTGITVQLGDPPPSAQRTPEWALAHLVTVSPEYGGRLRTLVYNLRQGAEIEPAFRNAFGKGVQDMQAEAKRHLEAGSFVSAPFPNRAMTPVREFPAKALDAAAVRLMRADLLLSAAACEDVVREKVHVAQAEECLGRLALRANQEDQARKHFARATEEGSESGEAWLEHARLTREKRAEALEKAIDLGQPEAMYIAAQQDPDPKRRVELLKDATRKKPRDYRYWELLAFELTDAKDFKGVARAWRSASQAAATPAERARLLAKRGRVDEERLDRIAEDKAESANKNAKELARLKEAAQAEVRALEEKFNKQRPGSDGKAEVVPWWDGPAPDSKLEGSLERIDCLRGVFRLVVQTVPGKPPRYLVVRDPGKITLINGAELSLGCGKQSPRRVLIEYWKKRDAALDAEGDVASIELR